MDDDDICGLRNGDELKRKGGSVKYSTLLSSPGPNLLDYLPEVVLVVAKLQ